MVRITIEMDGKEPITMEGKGGMVVLDRGHGVERSVVFKTNIASMAAMLAANESPIGRAVDEAASIRMIEKLKAMLRDKEEGDKDEGDEDEGDVDEGDELTDALREALGEDDAADGIGQAFSPD